jgi:hypothetical protein
MKKVMVLTLLVLSGVATAVGTFDFVIETSKPNESFTYV